MQNYYYYYYYYDAATTFWTSTESAFISYQWVNKHLINNNNVVTNLLFQLPMKEHQCPKSYKRSVIVNYYSGMALKVIFLSARP